MGISLLNLERPEMHYCFLNEDIKDLQEDPLILQKIYAQKIEKLLIGNLSKQQILNEANLPANLAGQKVLLRCSYDNMIAGLRLLQKYGVETIETETDIIKIENWYKLNLTQRKFAEISLSDIENGLFKTEVLEFFFKECNIFLKSVHKGFSAVINPMRILQHDQKLIRFLKRQCKKYGENLLLTNYCKIRTDSIGTRESRHIITNDNVINSSRFLLNLKHTVPRSHIIKAREIAKIISMIKSFPQNYVLDLGEFVDNDNVMYLDIVEINPLTCSLCYVNNSIFDYVLPEIREIQIQSRMGAEYCYDAIKKPQKYYIRRISNINYSCIASDRYFFL